MKDSMSIQLFHYYILVVTEGCSHHRLAPPSGLPHDVPQGVVFHRLGEVPLLIIELPRAHLLAVAVLALVVERAFSRHSFQLNDHFHAWGLRSGLVVVQVIYILTLSKPCNVDLGLINGMKCLDLGIHFKSPSF